MSKTKLPASKEEWFFENYKQDAVFEFGPVEVEEEEVLKFARRYDPQPFHIDPEAAKKSPYKGLIASGWQTCAFVMRELVEHYFSPVPVWVLRGLMNYVGFCRYVRETNSWSEPPLSKQNFQGQSPTEELSAHLLRPSISSRKLS